MGKKYGIMIAIVGMLIAGYFLIQYVEGINVPSISPEMGYGLLFMVGLLTGFHCISMCGGFVVSYTAKAAQDGKNAHSSHLMYGLGKTISYTIIGAAFGLLGAIVAFTPTMRGVAGIVAGIFLMLFGLNMFYPLKFFRKIQMRTPKIISRFVSKESRKQKSPLIIGLLNGLMIACGPLQAVYIMAAGTGSMVEGAKLLFIFGMGTLPVMLGFGYFASVISSTMTKRLLKASGVLVIIMGIFMLGNGMTLAGFDVRSMLIPIDTQGITGNFVVAVEDNVQTIHMNVTRSGWQPDTFVLQKDIPVRWVIDGQEITSCNNAIIVPKYGLEFDIKEGEQIIEFTPTQEGTISWSCWMGMIPGRFIVTDDVSENNIKETVESLPEQKSGSCGGSCGSSTCGATPQGSGSCGCGR